MQDEPEIIQPTAVIEPEEVRLIPKHPLPNKEQLVELVKVGAQIVTCLGTFDMAALRINDNDLSEELASIAPAIGWFAGYEAAAQHVLTRLELDLKRTRAELSQHWQTKKAAGEKLTVNDIEHNIGLDAGVQELEDQLADARYNLDLLKALRQAHDSKHRALQSAVGLRRTETDADIHRHRLSTLGASRGEGQGEVVLP